jgi:hypothetical protein
MESARDTMLEQLLDDTGAFRDPWLYDGTRTQAKRVSLNERIRRVFTAQKACVVQILVPLSSTFGFALNDSTAEGDSGMFANLIPLPPGTLIRFPLEAGDFLVMGVQSGQDALGLIGMPRSALEVV